MAKHKQTRAQLKAHLEEQLTFLELSAGSFDAGYVGEAKRMATTARILIHQTAASQALLTQLGMRSQKYFDASNVHDPLNLVSHTGLVGVRMSGGDVTYIAKLDGPEQRMTPFSRWWDHELILDDRKGGTFTRRGLVLALSNKDGGAHIDPHLDEAYANLKLNNSIGWVKVLGEGDEGIPVPDVELHSMRQIGHEILKTFRPGYAKQRPT